MVGERDDSFQSISVRLDGNNYSYWSYVMRNFLKGKWMWGYVSGVLSKPINDRDEKYIDMLESREANNSKILIWINNFVEHSIGIQLAKYEIAKQVWDHLALLYTQSNFAKQYQLESDIWAVQQKDEYPRVLFYDVWSLGSVGAHGARISSKQCWVSNSSRTVTSCWVLDGFS